MQPLSHHWADITAVKVIKSRGDERDSYTVASGITPSGMVHIGNFREVLTVDLVARALRKVGKKVRFIYSWDNFDTFRKVPKNVPDPEAFVKYLRAPIARIPDPWGEADSYSAGRIDIFENELKAVGIHPEFIYQEKMYSAGTYASQIRQALEGIEKIKAVLNSHRGTPLGDDWLPTSIYCESCNKDEMVYEKYLGEWSYSYKCASCGHEAVTDIRESKNLKLAWRVDWPMRWAFEKVDFEPGGKDHSSQGGSFDTAKDIVKVVWGSEAPTYLQYDFVMIKGGAGKMSSSSGELFTLSQVLSVYDPMIVRWIFANQRPNTDFSLAFDEDVIKTHEEFDRSEALAFTEAVDNGGKWQLNRRTYELACVEDKMPERAPFRPGFRQLCDRLQISDRDVEKTMNRYYSAFIKSEADRNAFLTRANCACQWLASYAPESFVYSLHASPVAVSMNDKQSQAIDALKQWLGTTNLDSMELKAINEDIYEKVIHAVDADPKEVFTAVYQKLIGRDQGPRLPMFLKEVGKERVLALLAD